MAAQLPREVQNKIKERVISINDDLQHEDAHNLIQQVKIELVNAGHSLTKGYRNYAAVSKVAVLDTNPGQTKSPRNESELDSAVNYMRGQYAPHKSRQHKSSQNWEYSKKRVACYICGKDHFWHYYPEKRCAKCVEKGHPMRECKDGFTDSKGQVMVTKLHGGREEMSVILPIKLSGEPINALLDSGAGPSVIDRNTLCKLGLDQLMDAKEGEVHSLSSEPVKVIGSLNIMVDIGDEQILEHSFEILTETEPTCVLGRNFLMNFGTTEFDWAKGQVRLGEIWKTAHMRIEGGEPLSRASVATFDILDQLSSLHYLQSHYNIQRDLSDRQRSLLIELLNRHLGVFAINPKRT